MTDPTDNKGNTYTRILNTTNIKAWIAYDAAGGVTTVTANNGAHCVMFLVEESGLNPSAVFNGGSTHFDAYGVYSGWTTGSVTTTAATVAYMLAGTVSSMTPGFTASAPFSGVTSGNGITNGDHPVTSYGSDAYLARAAYAAPGTYNPGGTITGNADIDSGVVFLTVASSASPLYVAHRRNVFVNDYLVQS